MMLNAAYHHDIPTDVPGQHRYEVRDELPQTKNAGKPPNALWFRWLERENWRGTPADHWLHSTTWSMQ